MAKTTKSWRDKYNMRTASETTTLETPFAGMKPGQLMLISTPKEIDDWVRSLKPGEFRTIGDLRTALAMKHHAEVTCPATTSIFLRIVAEVALEEIQAGAAEHAVTPFWRVIEPGSRLASRLSCSNDWIASMRSRES
jgi:hypothetical protein